MRSAEMYANSSIQLRDGSIIGATNSLEILLCLIIVRFMTKCNKHADYVLNRDEYCRKSVDVQTVRSAGSETGSRTAWVVCIVP